MNDTRNTGLTDPDATLVFYQVSSKSNVACSQNRCRSLSERSQIGLITLLLLVVRSDRVKRGSGIDETQLCPRAAWVGIDFLTVTLVQQPYIHFVRHVI